jgi:peptide chain release factor 1
MLEKLGEIKKEYNHIGQKLTQPEIISNQKEYQKLAKKHIELGKVIKKQEKLQKIEKNLKESKEIILKEKDQELVRLAEIEMEKLEKEKEKLEKELEIDLLPTDPNDEKDVIMEIRAGPGGEEAALFTSDLFRMYSRYAQGKEWNVEVLNSSRSEKGGFKEIIFEVKGKSPYCKLKYESGVHRVQRIPITESGGRIHTSCATVAVLPKAENVDIEINPQDLRTDTFRSSGPGGQHANVTDSAVRITHLPSGITASCQDEKSQLKNKNKALSILRSRILAKEQEEQRKARGEERRTQIGTGDRSEKIRTYNFPQDRITDHRIKLSVHNIESILAGNLDKIIEKLIEEDQTKRLALENK